MEPDRSVVRRRAGGERAGTVLSRGGGRRWVVPALALVAVVLRLPYLFAAEGADEGGYLAVARQWHPGGPSLYGHYWVDRPPLLIWLFQLASALGGLTALRVLAAVAAGLAVLGVARAARTVAGPRAATWSAAVAAALFASPLMGVVQVNGELLAAPFVAWSIALGADLVVDRVQPLSAARAGWSAFGAGALAVAALLVKQNMAEPVVFLVVAAAVAWRRGTLRGTTTRHVAVAGAGGLAVLATVGMWTVLHGTSLTGVFDAVYPFRIRAAAVLATQPDAGQVRRSHALLSATVASGTVVLVALFVWSVVRRRLRGPVAWGLAAALGYSTVSILLGGGFWDHYLVEAVVTVSVVAGLLVGEGGQRVRSPALLVPALAAAYVVASAVLHWGTGLGVPDSNRAASVGTAIRAAAAPGDTLVSAFGDAQAVDFSGLTSPYPYLWTLPAQVEDPRLSRLEHLLLGPSRPTWFVGWGRASFPAPVLQRLDAVVRAHYHLAGSVCGQPIYLRDGLVRPSLDPATPCSLRAADATGLL